MNNFLIYILQSGISLALFYCIYSVFLRKETYFNLNRAFLLGATILAMILPLIEIPLSGYMVSGNYTVWLNEVVVSPASSEGFSLQYFSPLRFLFLIYFAGAVYLSLRFLARIGRLLYFISRNKPVKEGKNRLIFINSDIAPFSFFNYIILNKYAHDRSQTEKIIAHEKIHIEQKHSLDLLLLELVIVLQWFNPFAWLIKKSLKDQHEYLADQGVLKIGFDKGEYLQLLMSHTFGMSFSTIANSFNHSQIKNRFTMITKKQSQKSASAKLFLILPAIAVLIYLFSFSLNEPVIGQTNSMAQTKLQGEDDKVYTVVDQIPEFPGGEEARIKFMTENITYPKEALKNGIQGRVFVTFVVEKDGKITNVKVLKGIGGGCDEEAARVISMMPSWTPGKKKGKPVRVQFNMPVQFKLDKKETESGTVPPPPPKSMDKAPSQQPAPRAADKK